MPIQDALSDLVHAVFERLLVKAKGLLGQLEPDADHMAHIHEALVQIGLVHLRGHEVDEAAQLVRQ